MKDSVPELLRAKIAKRGERPMKNPQLAPAQVSVGSNHSDETESTFRMNLFHTVRTSQWIVGTNIRGTFTSDMLQESMEIRTELN